MGGSAPFKLSQYYRSGGKVVDSAANALIPVAGIISLSNFYSSSAYSIPTVPYTSILVSPGSPFETAWANFGSSVAVSGTTAVVGANLQSGVSGESHAGIAYMFNVTNGGLLRTLYNPNANGVATDDAFGTSVAIYGDFVAVSAPWDAPGSASTSQGKVYVYTASTGAYRYGVQVPNSSSTNQEDLFGNYIAMDGNYLVVGAYYEDEAGGLNDGYTSGKAYVFNLATGALIWTLNNPNAYGTTRIDRFGTSVAISGTTIVASTPYEADVGGGASGKAYIFNATTGALVRTLSNPNADGYSANDCFGWSVSISGNKIVIGAPYETDNSGSSSESGKAYVFDATTGALLHTLHNPNVYGTATSDTFGTSVSISGNQIVVGAPGESHAEGPGSGTMYVFNATTGTLTYAIANPNGYSTHSGDEFGRSVAISGTSVVAGATKEDARILDAGAAYAFTIVG